MAFIELQDAYQEVLNVNPPPRDEIQKSLRFSDVEPLKDGLAEKAGGGTNTTDEEGSNEEKFEEPQERETPEATPAPLADSTSVTGATGRPEDTGSGGSSYSVAVIG